MRIAYRRGVQNPLANQMDRGNLRLVKLNYGKEYPILLLKAFLKILIPYHKEERKAILMIFFANICRFPKLNAIKNRPSQVANFARTTMKWIGKWPQRLWLESRETPNAPRWRATFTRPLFAIIYPKLIGGKWGLLSFFLRCHPIIAQTWKLRIHPIIAGLKWPKLASWSLWSSKKRNLSFNAASIRKKRCALKLVPKILAKNKSITIDPDLLMQRDIIHSHIIIGDFLAR